MKHFFKLTTLAAVATAFVITFSAFNTPKQTETTDDRYVISIVERSSVARTSGEDQTWTWSLTNPNPGNGLDGTLQNVSHFSISLTPQAEAAFVSAEYSFDGVTWVSLPLEVDRDPSIRQCTTTDVLKFDAGTVGSDPTYYRVTFNQEFENNPYSTSWIKSGNRTGCNQYYFAGPGAPKLD